MWVYLPGEIQPGQIYFVHGGVKYGAGIYLVFFYGFDDRPELPARRNKKLSGFLCAFPADCCNVALATEYMNRFMGGSGACQEGAHLF